MNRKINDIKDRIYEAEGLLELLQLRHDKLQELYPLIEARLAEATRMLAVLKTSDDTVGEQVDTDVIAPEPKVPEVPEVAEVAEVEVTETFSAPVTPNEPDVEVVVPKMEKKEEPVAAPKPVRETRRLPSFCLNDRYRFRRSIFGGSDAEFNATIDHLATLDSYTEAEELFFGDMGLNPEDPDVVDFMGIIKDYFGI